MSVIEGQGIFNKWGVLGNVVHAKQRPVAKLIVATGHAIGKF